MIRRPLILAIIIIFAAGAGWVGWNSTNGEAQSRTSVLVVPPWYLESESAPNPVLNLTDRTTQLASALVIAMQTNDTATFVADTGATGYTASNIGDNLRYPEPTSVIQFVVTGPDQAAAHAGAQRLIDKSRQVLTAMQVEAAIGTETNTAKLQVIVPPEETMSLVGKQKIRAATVFGLAAFLACLLVYWAVESGLDRRSRKRASRIKDVPAVENSKTETLGTISTNGHGPLEPAHQSI
jgi:capsular polysaccharide biosynthesis protein